MYNNSYTSICEDLNILSLLLVENKSGLVKSLINLNGKEALHLVWVSGARRRSKQTEKTPHSGVFHGVPPMIWKPVGNSLPVQSELCWELLRSQNILIRTSHFLTGLWGAAAVVIKTGLRGAPNVFMGPSEKMCLHSSHHSHLRKGRENPVYFNSVMMQAVDVCLTCAHQLRLLKIIFMVSIQRITFVFYSSTANLNIYKSLSFDVEFWAKYRTL